MTDIYKNVADYNPNKERKILIANDDIIADIFSHEKLNPVVTDLFTRGRDQGKKLNILLALITQYYFTVPKNIRLNSTH